MKNFALKDEELCFERCVRSVGFFWAILHDIFNPT
jgi:hypothetical protein